MKRQSIHSHSAGFTLVELLAVIAITGVVGTLMFGILFTTLKGADKSQSIGIIQQNGNTALSQMARMIRYASAVQSPTTCYSGPTPIPVAANTLTILSADNYSTTFVCDATNGTLSSNSASMIDTNNVAVTVCSITCQQTNAYDSPTFTLAFTLNKKGSNNLVENMSPIQFQSSVTLRNVR